MNREQREARVEEYGRGFELLRAALAKVPKDAWEFRPAPGEWSAHEIVVHMGDSESMAALRARKLIVEPGSTLMGYEEAKWAGALGYEKQDREASLEIIKLARQTTYRLLKSLPDEAFEHTVKHQEYPEPYTFDKWLDIYARHIPDHIAQIEGNVESWKKQPR